jgi:hypothetical protein
MSRILLPALLPVLACVALVAEDTPPVAPAAPEAAQPVVAPIPAPKADARKPAADARPALFVNVRVAARSVQLNQPVRVEFFTPARQLESVDIAAAVSSGLVMAGADTWRLVGKPTVVENEKIRSVTVSFTLLPRTVGELALPRFPLTWLAGEPLPEMGVVKVESGIVVGSERKPLPREVDGVAGFPWGVALKDLLGKELKGEQVEAKGEISVAKPRLGLELTFQGGELAGAELDVPDLDPEAAQVSFVQRWGVPQLTLDDGAPAWLLGWTRIVVKPRTNGGVVLHLIREDVLARAAASKVKDAVFDILEGNK